MISIQSVTADGSILPPSDYVLARSLAANTAENVVIPSGAHYVLISSSAATYVRFGGAGITATVPGDVTDGSASELLPNNNALRAIVGARTIGSVSSGSTQLSVLALDGFTIGDSITVKGAGAAGGDLTVTISAINVGSNILTLSGTASTTVQDAVVIESVAEISAISAGTPVVTFAFYK
jgi:hypothetical protein